jgi:mannose-6-phosphate isomerase-like protein (cupin superfamily)
MSHSADVVNDHKNKPRGVEEETLEKRIAHILPGEGRRSLWVLGELVTYKIPSHKTGGAYSLFEVASLPSTGPPPHIHHREDEAFYVLEGEYKFLIGREPLRVGAGSLIYVPKGTLHAHRSVGEGVGRMLVTQTPGGLYERFFEEVGKPVVGGAGPLVFEDLPDMRRIVEAAAEYGIEIPLPIA